MNLVACRPSIRICLNCWVSVMKSRVMRFIVNVSSDLSGGGIFELIRDLDAT